MFVQLATTTDTAAAAADSDSGHQVITISLFLTFVAITLGITVSRHLIKSDELATADPAHVIELLRPCMLSLTARPDDTGPRKR